MSVTPAIVPVTADALRPHLEAYWLRPESALWDAIAASRLEPLLAGRRDLLELGIGNGFFSFLMLGGRFASDFDWFLSARTDGFWQHQDIFDHDAGIDIAGAITHTPHTRIRYGLDHKPSLLAQARRLSFVDDLVAHDGNEPLPAMSYASAYSNILYWLRDPLAAMDRIADGLPQGGELITVFPNSAFYENCRSYTADDAFWKLINRGRADHIMWHMDPDPFRAEIGRRGRFEIRELTRYLAPLTLKIWDIGLRPLTVPLIQMANGLPAHTRRSVKQEWCDTLARLAEPVLAREAEAGAMLGGFCLAVLVKK